MTVFPLRRSVRFKAATASSRVETLRMFVRRRDPRLLSPRRYRARHDVRIDGHAGGLGAIHHRPFPMASGEMLAVYRKPNVF
jgi:hypothetical protein